MDRIFKNNFQVNDKLPWSGLWHGALALAGAFSYFVNISLYSRPSSCNPTVLFKRIRFLGLKYSGLRLTGRIVLGHLRFFTIHSDTMAPLWMLSLFDHHISKHLDASLKSLCSCIGIRFCFTVPKTSPTENVLFYQDAIRMATRILHHKISVQWNR